MGKILLYGLNYERKDEVNDLLTNNGFTDIDFLERESGNLLVGYLHSLDGYEKENHTPKDVAPEIEFMMISGFDGAEIKTLVTLFKEANINRPVTSTLTKINKDWVFADLIKEVYEEHLEMTRQKI